MINNVPKKITFENNYVVKSNENCKLILKRSSTSKSFASEPAMKSLKLAAIKPPKINESILNCFNINHKNVNNSKVDFHPFELGKSYLWERKHFRVPVYINCSFRDSKI